MQATDIDRLADAVVERMRAERDERPLLTIEEAADRLAISARTLRAMVAAEKIGSVKVHGARRFEPAELDRYIAENRGGAR